MKMEQFKICSHCKQEKEIGDFFKNSYYCKKCDVEHTLKSRKKSDRWSNYLKRVQTEPYMIYSHKKANAKKEGIKFTIKKREFINWYKSQKLEGTYCGLPPSYFKNVGDKFLSVKVNLSIDRKDNNRGYELDNIALSCSRCNTIKNSFFTYEDMKEIGQKFVKLKWKAKGVPLDN